MVAMFRTKRRTSVPDDIGEARSLRDEADTDLTRVQGQAPYVARLTARLIQRRELNHFGDSIQVTFSPKGTNV